MRRKGRQPRTANMLVEDHLRPAAVAAEVLTEDDPRRFGFHNLRHSLSLQTSPKSSLPQRRLDNAESGSISGTLCVDNRLL
jgi:hypothetical protein